MSKDKFFIILVCIFALILRFTDLNSMGRTMDEDYIVEKGHKFLQLTLQGDFTNSYWYSVPDHPPLGNYLFGILAPLDVSGFDHNRKAHDSGYVGVTLFNYDLTYSRIVAILLSVLTIVVTMIVGLRYFSRTVAVASGIILSSIPFFLGLSQIVSLDIVFSAFFTFATASFFYFLEKPSYKRAIAVGILTGCVLLTKQTGVIIYPLMGATFIVWFMLNKKKSKKSLSKMVLIILLSCLTVFLLWPMIWFHLPYVIAHNDHMWFKGGGYPEWFLGRLMIAPVFYYFVYVFITIPLLVLIAFLYGGIDVLRNAIKTKKWILYALLLWFIVPFIIQSLYIGRQHQLRYLSEIFPPIALLAGIGFAAIVKKYIHKPWKKIVLYIVLIVYLILQLLTVKPYYLDYFNELVGGTDTVYKERWFQIGFGGQGERDASLFLAKHAPKGSVVALCLDPTKNMMPLKNIYYKKCDLSQEYDYVVVNYYNVIRDGFDETPVKNKYRLVHTVYAGKVELVHVYKKR